MKSIAENNEVSGNGVMKTMLALAVAVAFAHASFGNEPVLQTTAVAPKTSKQLWAEWISVRHAAAGDSAAARQIRSQIDAVTAQENEKKVDDIQAEIAQATVAAMKRADAVLVSSVAALPAKDSPLFADAVKAQYSAHNSRENLLGYRKAAPECNYHDLSDATDRYESDLAWFNHLCAH